MMDERQKANTQPCLICASPCCSTHSSSNFRKEGITVCLECERLFELDFIVDCVSTPDATERAKHIDHMIDCYDRCLLLLQYSAQYIDQIALSLEQNQEQRNKIGLGSSGVGAFSGVRAARARSGRGHSTWALGVLNVTGRRRITHKNERLHVTDAAAGFNATFRTLS